MNDCDVKAGFYALNLQIDKNLTAEVNGSKIQGWCALNDFTNTSQILFDDCDLIGYNRYNKAANEWNDFSVNKTLVYPKCKLGFFAAVVPSLETVVDFKPVLSGQPVVELFCAPIDFCLY